MKHVYVVDDCDWFVAETPEQALELWRAYMRETVGENPEYYELTPKDAEQVPDDKTLKVFMEDAPDGEQHHSDTAENWAKGQDVGFLASTEF